MNAEEYLDIVDGEGEPTGRTKARSLVHRDGDLHRTSHVWIARRKGGRLQLLLQKRSRNKDSHPGCYDISSAGHIPAGSDFEDSALRELCAVLGIPVEKSMAFGDGLNDMSMIRDAGVGVAMANAVPEVRAAADRIAPSNDEDGVAQVIEALLGI